LILKAFKPKISKVLTNAPENPVTLGGRIRKRRIELKLYQKELAILVGVSEDTIRNWESNRRVPRRKLLQKIKTILFK